MKSDVIERIKILLKELNLSENAFAIRINMPQTTVSSWLNRRRKPQMEFATVILKNFENVSAEWLLRGEGKMYKEEGKFSTENVKSDISRLQGSCIDKSLYVKLVKAIMRGCPSTEEQDKILEDLNKILLI